MPEFKKGNKKAVNHKGGPKVIKRKNRSGYYIAWCELRAKLHNFTITSSLPHNLSLKTAKKAGLKITKNPKKNALLADCAEIGDVILKIAGEKVNTVEEFNLQLNKFIGKQILVKINKGGKTGTVTRIVKAGRTREQAQKNLRNFDDFIEKKRNINSKKSVLFSQLVNDFLDWAETPEADYSKSWLKDVKRIITIHSKRWGALPIEQITPAEIQKWINTRSKDVAASTLNNELSPLRKAFKLAVKLDYIKEDPTRKISFRKPAESVHKALSKEDVNTLLKITQTVDDFRLNPTIPFKSGIKLKTLGQTPDELRKNRYNKDGTFDSARIRFLLLTALRKSQFIDLKWEQYDKKRGTITLQTTEEHSEKSRRINIIPLPKKAKEIIDGQPNNSEYIFLNLCGGHDLSFVNRLFRRIFKSYEEQTGKHIHLHMLRHTAITQLLRHTNNIVLVKNFAGHRKIETTLIYTKILTDEMAKAVTDFDI